MKFEDYHIAAEIKLSLQELAYKKPTDIQFKAIPSILKGEDVMAIAQTGTGKTAAFAIPVIHLLHRKQQAQHPPGIKCVVLAPTHELAHQISEVFEQVGKYTELNFLCITGGVEQAPQISNLEEGVDVLIATPGRMFDLLSQGHIELNRVEILILDEADHMLDLGFIQDIDDLIRKLPQDRQTLFFSATLNQKIKKVAYSVVRNAIRIQISPKDPVAKNIDHGVAFIEMDAKRFFLERMVKENPESKILVFVRTIVRAERVVKAMERVGIIGETLHRDKTEAERSKIMEEFKSGEITLLIATDITARGIDVPDVDYVINYDLPDQSENYVHRVGRTGRGRKRGTAVTFCSPEERPTLVEIETFLGHPIQVLQIGKANYLDTLKLEQENKGDWRTLMGEADEVLGKKKKMYYKESKQKGKKTAKKSGKKK